MTVQKQWAKVKENWLLLVLVIALFLLFSSGSQVFFGGPSLSGLSDMSYSMEKAAMPGSFGIARGGMSPLPGGDFAPEVKDRLITKTAYLATEVERGAFQEAESQLEAAVQASGAFLLTQDVSKQGKAWRATFLGRYEIKVEASKYEAMVSQLKTLGEVQSFNENSLDITGRHVDLRQELGAERERLTRYWAMYGEATEIADKIELNDRIFNQERTVKYLEDALANLDRQVQYSTIHVTLQEKQSEYLNIAFVKLSELVSTFVSSVNAVITLIVALLPWALALGLLWVAFRFVKKRV